MKYTKQENGVIAIFMSVIVGILLLTTTTFAARVSINELNQASAVDRSEQAYYAAEAGIEEAIRRLDNNPNATSCQIFPEQFYSDDPNNHTSAICPAAQPGDKFQLANSIGSGFTQARPIYEDAATNAAEFGQTSWRHRKVYAQSTSYSGTQAKDQTIQFDASDLRRRCPGIGNEVGSNGLDCNGTSSIFANFKGMRYCWDDGGNTAIKIEATVVSFDPNFTNFQTEKSIIDHGTFPNRVNASYTSGPGNCTDIQVNNSGRRYIFRLKPIFSGAVYNDPNDVAQFRFAVPYQAALNEAPLVPAGQRLYIPDDTYLIDVVGQSGDIRRRLVAKKERKGRLLGIFDYVLYSADSTKDLCKSGVNSTDVLYDPNTCTVVTNAVAPSLTTMTYNVRTDASITQQASGGCDTPASDASAANDNTLQLCSGTLFSYSYTYAGPAGAVNKFYIDTRQDIDTGAPGPAQIRVIITSPSGTITQVVNATGTTYAQHAIDISSLGLKDGDSISVSIQFINDSCTGCGTSPRPANTDLNAYIDYFGVTNGGSLP